MLLDLDGVLMDHRTAMREGVHAWLGDRATPEVIAAWSRATEAHLAAWRAGEVSWAEQRRNRLRDVLPLLGEPVDANQDVGLAIRKGETVEVKVFSGKSALNPGDLTDKVEKVGRLLSPLSQEEVGTIRCIGLNVSRILPEEQTVVSKLTNDQYTQHAKEVNMDAPPEPVLFL